MAQVSGITLERNTGGKPTHVRIDLRKYGKDLYPFLLQYGVLIEEPNDETKAAIKESYNLKNAKKYSSGSELLVAMRALPNRTAYTERKKNDKLDKLDNAKKEKYKLQWDFINSWLLPCSLRSHRTANPRPKMAKPIFGRGSPTT